MGAFTRLMEYELKMKEQETSREDRAHDRNVDTLLAMNQDWNDETFKKCFQYYKTELESRLNEDAERHKQEQMLHQNMSEDLSKKMEFLLKAQHNLITADNIDQKVDEILQKPPISYSS
ncbi:hypothetical protein Ciccas_004801 [Cichlidogyrus casuarinus]|uniref:Uncharacterized protein n=1 Tax=Cichlidogyrus casuarinus TaxID=1844966 RepID=A0ABD2QAH9_9PLAT